MTGQNSARHRVTQWINPESKNHGPAGWNWKGLTSKDITLPALLKKNGYHTIFSGKAHFAPTEYEGANPTNLGFDVNIAGCAFGAPGSYFGEDGYGNLDPKRKKRAIPGLEKYHNTDVFLSEAITREAISAIDQSLQKEAPFFLYMSHYAAHSPFQTDPRFGNNYKDSGKSRPANSFATLIEGMDKSLGDLMDHLVREGVAQNTLILFVGDNGSDAPLGDTYGYFSSAPSAEKPEPATKEVCGRSLYRWMGKRGESEFLFYLAKRSASPADRNNNGYLRHHTRCHWNEKSFQPHHRWHHSDSTITGKNQS